MSNTVSAKYNPALLTMPSLYLTLESYQSGAVEACWAQNPEVRGSKPRSAKKNVFIHQNLYWQHGKLGRNSMKYCMSLI